MNIIIKAISKNFFKPEFLLLYLFILIGSYLRLSGVFTNSFAYTYDVGRDLLAIQDLVSGQKISLIGPTTGLPGVFYGPWWYLMLSPFFLIFNGNPQGIAFIMALTGILLIPLGFILGKKSGNEFSGLIIAGLISVSPELISLSSQIWNPNIAPLFVLITFLILFNIFSKKSKNIYYFLLGIILFLTLDIEIIFGLFFSTGIVLSVLFIKKIKIQFSSIILFIFGGLIILSPRILFEVKHKFLMTQSFIRYFLNGAESERVAGGVLNTILNRLEVFSNEFSYTLSSSNKIFGLIIFIVCLFLISYFFKKMSEIEKKLIYTIGIIISVFFFGTIVFAHDIWPHYLVGLPIVYILFVSLSLSFLRYKFKSNKVPVILFVILFTINLNPAQIINNINKPLWEGDAALYRNQLSVVDYVYTDASDTKFKYVVYTPPVHDYTYQYLFNYIGKQQNKNPVVDADVAYFILEPDKENPKRLQDWLIERKSDGEIVESKIFSGEIIVQKRIVRNEK